MKFEEQQLNQPEREVSLKESSIENQNQEQLPDIDEFSQQAISEIENSPRNLSENGEAELQRSMSEKSLQFEDVEKSKSLSQKYEALLKEFSQRGKEFADTATRDIKRLVVGASMLAATSGSMEGVAMANATDKPVKGTHVEEVLQGESEKESTDLSSPEFMGDAETKEKIAQTERATKLAKEELLSQMSSKEYLEKMTLECDGDKSAAESQVHMRIKNLEKTKIKVETQEDIRKIIVDKINKELKETLGVLESEDGAHHSDLEEIAKKSASEAMEIAKGAEFLGYTEKETGVHIAYDGESLATTPTHELSHASTGGINTLPLKTVDLFRDAFKSTPDTEMLDFYFSNADEMLARKKELDKDLERLGIKKYGDPTTDAQLEKIKQSYDKGELSTGSMQLIEHVKKGYLKKILDQVAKNEDKDAIFVG